MHRIARGCVLFLWIHTLAFVKSQNLPCTLESFLQSNRYDKNFDTTTLEDSYPSGGQVRVGCVIGHSGFFKMTCNNGGWEYRGTTCQPRSCGHPGDAQFADFHLVEGDDFVFGSQVTYTCHKGYQMVSRKNYRTCLAGGWDGSVPVCEAQSCQSFDVANNIVVNGDTQDATYGNVVRFSCRSNTDVLYGSSEMYCDENGQWVGEVPRCEAVKCTVPDIDNGYVPGGSHAQRVYNEHEILHFACNDLYKRADDRPSRCTMIGDKAEFSPTPACETIKCKLDQRTPEGTTYRPEYRNMFLPGETLTVRCGEKYYFSHVRETTAEVTCKEDGQWTVRPVCRAHCQLFDVPHNVVVNGDTQDTTYGSVVRFSCRSNADFLYGSSEMYCDENGQWVGTVPRCEVMSRNCTPPPEVENAVAVSSQQEKYLPGSHITYRCHDSYTMEGGNTLQCINGKWEKNFMCTRGCEAPPVLEDGDVKYTIKSQYSHNETVEYQCQAYYTMEGEPYRTCISGEWTGFMRCLKPCIVDEDSFRKHNITLKSRDKSYFNHDEMMEFRCARGRPVGAVAMNQRCNSGVIVLPTCQ